MLFQLLKLFKIINLIFNILLTLTMCQRGAENYTEETLYSVIAGGRVSVNTKCCW